MFNQFLHVVEAHVYFTFKRRQNFEIKDQKIGAGYLVEQTIETRSSTGTRKMSKREQAKNS